MPVFLVPTRVVSMTVDPDGVVDLDRGSAPMTHPGRNDPNAADELDEAEEPAQ